MRSVMPRHIHPWASSRWLPLLMGRPEPSAARRPTRRCGRPAPHSNEAGPRAAPHPPADRPRSFPPAGPRAMPPNVVATVRPPLRPSASGGQCRCCCIPLRSAAPPVRDAPAPARCCVLARDSPVAIVHARSTQSAEASVQACRPPCFTSCPILAGTPHLPVVLRLSVLGEPYVELQRIKQPTLVVNGRHDIM